MSPSLCVLYPNVPLPSSAVSLPSWHAHLEHEAAEQELRDEASCEREDLEPEEEQDHSSSEEDTDDQFYDAADGKCD